MKHLDLFSGIGGFAIAAQDAGFETIAFCEYEPRCRAFLERTWGLPVHRDIRELDARQYRGRLSLLTGGPPCQPASRAGKQGGESDDRWLWGEAVRVVEEAQPDWFVFENPPGILDVGLDGILSDLEALGYEIAPPFDIPACAVDSPQLRHRLWIVGNRVLADASSQGHEERGMQPGVSGREGCPSQGKAIGMGDEDDMADSERIGRERRTARSGEEESRESFGATAGLHWKNAVWVPCADGKLRRAPDDSIDVVDGLHRSLLGALGNSIVPQVAFQILKAIAQVIQ